MVCLANPRRENHALTAEKTRQENFYFAPGCNEPRAAKERNCTGLAAPCTTSRIRLEYFSEDPIGFAAGDANLYRYVGNSPTNATDPSGLVTRISGGAPQLREAPLAVETTWTFKVNAPNDKPIAVIQTVSAKLTITGINGVTVARAHAKYYELVARIEPDTANPTRGLIELPEVDSWIFTGIDPPPPARLCHSATLTITGKVEVFEMTPELDALLERWRSLPNTHKFTGSKDFTGTMSNGSFPSSGAFSPQTMGIRAIESEAKRATLVVKWEPERGNYVVKHSPSRQIDK